MAFIRIKTIKGVKYYYLVESKREGGKVKQKILQYFGTTPPEGVFPGYKAFVVPKKETRPVKAKKATKKAGPTKTMDKVEPSVVPSKVSTTPPKAIVPTDKSYYLGYSVSGLGSVERKTLKNFGTTLPSDADIVTAIGTTRLPEVTHCYLVERTQRGTRVRDKIIKSYLDIDKLISTTPMLIPTGEAGASQPLPDLPGPPGRK